MGKRGGGFARSNEGPGGGDMLRPHTSEGGPILGRNFFSLSNVGGRDVTLARNPTQRAARSAHGTGVRRSRDAKPTLDFRPGSSIALTGESLTLPGSEKRRSPSPPRGKRTPLHSPQWSALPLSPPPPHTHTLSFSHTLSLSHTHSLSIHYFERSGSTRLRER